MPLQEAPRLQLPGIRMNGSFTPIVRGLPCLIEAMVPVFSLTWEVGGLNPPGPFARLTGVDHRV